MNSADSAPSKRRDKEDRPSKPYVKKPLNAFMLYMKEQRAKVVAECTLKESAAINQILGRKVGICVNLVALCQISTLAVAWCHE